MSSKEQVEWFRNWAWDRGVSTRIVNIFSREIGLGKATLDYICEQDREWFYVMWAGVGVESMLKIGEFLEDLRKDWANANSVGKEVRPS